MKLKITSLIAIGIGAFASFAGAQTTPNVIDITGSTAGRAAVHAQILASLTSTTFAYYSAVGTTNVAKGDSYIYKGKLGTNDVIIRCYYGGSVNGVKDVGTIGQSKLLATTTATAVGGGTSIPSPVYAASTDGDSKPEIGFSDVFAASTGFAGPANNAQVAIIPFKWYRNKGSLSTITNMTPSLFNATYANGNGFAPAALFTGSSADEGNWVYAIGRDSSSGTRITALAETGHGVFQPVSQNTVTYNGTTFVASTVNFVGDLAGFDSGSKVAASMKCTYDDTADVANPSGGSTTVGTMIGYIGSSDWLARTAPVVFPNTDSGAVELTWNGAAYSQANLFNGIYTFWGYLHMNWVTPATGSILETFVTTLKNNLIANPGAGSSGLEKETDMRVKRAGDGATVTAKYF